MDNILERAAERMRELESRRRKLQTMLADVEKELSQFESFFAVASKLGAETPTGAITPTAATTAAEAAAAVPPVAVWPAPTPTANAWAAITRLANSAAHGSKSRVIAEAAARIIGERGALSSRKILEALDEKGIGQTLVPGRDEKGRVGYLSAVLSKDDRFASDRDAGGYVVVEPKEETPPTEGQEGPNIKDLL